MQRRTFITILALIWTTCHAAVVGAQQMRTAPTWFGDSIWGRDCAVFANDGRDGEIVLVGHHEPAKNVLKLIGSVQEDDAAPRQDGSPSGPLGLRLLVPEAEDENTRPRDAFEQTAEVDAPMAMTSAAPQTGSRAWAPARAASIPGIEPHDPNSFTPLPRPPGIIIELADRPAIRPQEKPDPVILVAAPDAEQSPPMAAIVSDLPTERPSSPNQPNASRPGTILERRAPVFRRPPPPARGNESTIVPAPKSSTRTGALNGPTAKPKPHSDPISEAATPTPTVFLAPSAAAQSAMTSKRSADHSAEPVTAPTSPGLVTMARGLFPRRGQDLSTVGWTAQVEGGFLEPPGHEMRHDIASPAQQTGMSPAGVFEDGRFVAREFAACDECRACETCNSCLMSEACGPSSIVDPCSSCQRCEPGERCEAGAEFSLSGEVIWTARAQAVFLNREASQSRSELVRSTSEPDGIFRANELEHDFSGGARVGLVRQIDAGYGLDVIYLGGFNWDESNRLTGNLNILGQAIGPGTAVVNYGSELHSIEANVRLPLDSWSKFLVGFRWVSLEEDAFIHAPGFFRGIATDNDLWGGQIGYERAIWDRGDCLTIDGSVKAGAFCNKVGSSTRGFAGMTGEDDNRPAFVGEASLFANYQLTPCWSVTAGYEVYWLDGVALAVDQYPDPRSLDDEGGIFLHGASVGLRFDW